MTLTLFTVVLALPFAFAYATDISHCDLKLDDASFEFTGDAIVPKSSMDTNIITLDENADYTLSYENNVEVGTATVTAEGKGLFRGKVSKTFKITKAIQKISGENSFRKNIAEDFNLKQGAETELTFKSSDDNIAIVESNGQIKPKAVGKIIVTVSAEGNDNYEPATKEITVEITETPTQEAIRETLEWARKIAADDSYTYGHGSCPNCHSSKKVYDCIGFMSAAYWHGGKTDFMKRWCTNHSYVSVVRSAMKGSSDWKNLGNLSTDKLEPGDVLFYYSPGRGKNGSGWFHVETYNGNGEVVGAHTFSGQSKISVEPFNNYFRSYTDVYRYVGD